MAKITENYEAMVIFSTKLEDEGAALIEKFDAMIKDNAESVSGRAENLFGAYCLPVLQCNRAAVL